MSCEPTTTDVILIGAGIMSATLGALLKELAPDWQITVFEKLDKAGEEASNEWNNAGTGHAALCELNYTRERPDGSIDIAQAVKVNEQFQVSKQFWAHLVRTRRIANPQDFIMPLPHLSYVQGERNVQFLKSRYEAMSSHPLFQGMEYSENPEQLMEWIPLMMKNRNLQEPVAVTKVDYGTDVNFGALTRILLNSLQEQQVNIHYGHNVTRMDRTSDGRWEIGVKDLHSGEIKRYTARFVFIGAGGGSLHLLQKSGIPEGKHIGGFPVSGLFLVCNNPEIIGQHHAKVYGKASVGAPPMSVPHLDTRFIDSRKSLLFGPFAGFSPKFLKTGSMMDLLTSIKSHNLLTMMAAGVKELSLTKYLVQQLLLSKEQRIEELRQFVPDARSEDWDLVVAGQRVQVIKDTPEGKGQLRFGTEVISSADGSVAALLGASPGASTAVHVMLEVLQRCFPQHLPDWEPKIKEMIPSYGLLLSEQPELLREIEPAVARALGLTVMTSLAGETAEPLI